jgi:acyl-CoA thioesterase II
LAAIVADSRAGDSRKRRSYQSAMTLHPPPRPLAPAESIARLVHLLDVEPIEVDLFRGQSTEAGWQRVYGGQVVAQALMAASKTVPADRLAHSLHCYFLRPGDPKVPILYRVERDRDGASFTTRRVVAIQHERPIFDMATSFQIIEQGLEHSFSPPQVAGPEGLKSEAELNLAMADRIPESRRVAWLERDRPIEFRPVDLIDPITPTAAPPFQNCWFRTAAPVAADPALARCLLAYASDMTLLDTCLMPHAIAWADPRLQGASLDHAMWFHRTPDMSNWLLFAGQPRRRRRPRAQSRDHIRSRRNARRQRDAGRIDSVSRGLTRIQVQSLRRAGPWPCTRFMGCAATRTDRTC